MGLFDELFNARSLYFDVFDKMIEAVYICDTDRNLIYFNRAAEKLDGYLLKDVKGKSTYELYGLDETESPMLRALTTERPVVNEEFSYYVNGKEVVQLCNSGPIYEEGRLIGAYTVQRDLTMYKDIMEKISRCSAPSATIRITIVTEKMTLSPGLSAAVKASAAVWLRRGRPPTLLPR